MITKQEIKTTAKTILIVLATWWIALPLGDYIVDHSPIKNTIILGVIMLAALLFWD